MKVLLVTPPFIQTNSPYPATAYLSRFLKDNNIQTDQFDLSLELHLKIFSRAGVERLQAELLKSSKKKISKIAMSFLQSFEGYRHSIDDVIQFLQGGRKDLIEKIINRDFLPEGSRFQLLNQFGLDVFSSFQEVTDELIVQYICSLYLDDIYDVIKTEIDPDFGFSNYAEALSSSQISYDPILQKLNGQKNFLDEWMIELFQKKVEEVQPDLIGFTVPFAGNFYSALRLSDFVQQVLNKQSNKQSNKKIKTVMGGGYVNTELRGIEDARLFESVDYLIYDDGEKPLLHLIRYLNGQLGAEGLIRTKMVVGKKIVYQNNFTVSNSDQRDIPFKALRAPDYSGLNIESYFSMMEIPNPMRRMWTGFRWNKLILAHGCYWKKCSFCDVTLDYIGRFEPQKAENIVDQMEEVIAQTGVKGFHFVDEAAPPALLRQVSLEIIKRGLKIQWWGNLRFDSQFDDELVALMSKAGCIAVTGGLEVASPRLLELIHKGLTIEQVAQVTKRFKDNHIYVHAYLMYGFPSQTENETIDSLEVVRQLFLNNCIDSGYWHRFMATVHSPVGRNPEKYGIQLNHYLRPQNGKFAEYSVPFVDSVVCDHELLALGLNKAIYNYMHGIGIKEKVEVWFDHPIPQTKVPKNYIQKFIK